MQADFAGVRILAEHLRLRCEAAGVDTASIFDLELAVVEAANNVIDHGFDVAGHGKIGFSLTAANGCVTAILTDCGRAVPEVFFEDGAMPEPLSSRGRGAGIIQACVDTVSYASSGGGNRLVLTKCYRPTGG
ncbi:ATP-binding protein [Novosphingobium sp. BL-52-GroH]|uniref:ATP-binding protein n=1 Tax=Novosphingobium sp. BL-52-GroH TaxID=3349877 RepID=UPI00384DE476